ncbi:MAG: CBS domain-containing protein [Opitutaceae bacterium]|nr:CBS domain-containing protein [Opitutaceae bacterium]
MNTSISTLLERKGTAVRSIAPTLTVAESVHEMNRHKISSLLVMEGERVVGIFTERDVLRRVIGVGLDPKQARINEVMTREVATILPESTVEEAMEIFRAKHCRHLPVMVAGRVAGVISIGDISRWLTDVHRAEAEHLKNYINGGMQA